MRGCWSTTASSPKKSPSLRSASSSLPRITRALPERITYRPVPTCPCRTMKLPAAKSCSPATSASRSIDSAVIPAKSGTRASQLAFWAAEIGTFSTIAVRLALPLRQSPECPPGRISKPANVSSAANHVSSTLRTTAPGGPERRWASSLASAAEEPSATTRTVPSGSLRTQPTTDRRPACRRTNQRNPTPCTSPRMIASRRRLMQSCRDERTRPLEQQHVEQQLGIRVCLERGHRTVEPADERGQRRAIYGCSCSGQVVEQAQLAQLGASAKIGKGEIARHIAPNEQHLRHRRSPLRRRSALRGFGRSAVSLVGRPDRRRKRDAIVEKGWHGGESNASVGGCEIKQRASQAGMNKHCFGLAGELLRQPRPAPAEACQHRGTRRIGDPCGGQKRDD